MTKKLISIVTPTYNENLNLDAIYQSIKRVMSELPDYDYEHLFIDNASTDGTQIALRKLSESDKRVKVILNTRNFGHIRSPYHGLLQSRGDAAIIVAADLQDPPETIKQFVKYWELGFKIVVGIKANSDENPLMFRARKLYYKVLNRMTETPLIENYMGFGLYDKVILTGLRNMDEPYPYLRGLISELGYDVARVPYAKPKRINGKSHNNLYVLFDIVMLGFTNNTKIPLRLATMLGFGVSLVSFIVGLIYLIYKLLNWQNFEVGLAPIVIGMSFLGGVQLLFLGIIGEYVGQIYTQVLHRPLVIEKERINFD